MVEEISGSTLKITQNLWYQDKCASFPDDTSFPEPSLANIIHHYALFSGILYLTLAHPVQNNIKVAIYSHSYYVKKIVITESNILYYVKKFMFV